MQCDKCYKRIEEDDTYEHILCGYCIQNEQIIHCTRCGAAVKWTKTLENVREFCEFIDEEFNGVKWFGYAALVVFVVALEWRNLKFDSVLAGILVSLFYIIATVVSLAIAVPCAYHVGKWTGKKLGWNMPEISETPAGGLTWLWGLLVCSCPILVYYLGRLLEYIGNRGLGH